MMADYDSNMIKPVEGLQSITGLTPAKRREEKKQQQQLKQESEEKDEQLMDDSDEQQDKDNFSQSWAENPNNMNPESTGIDYCA